MAHEERILERIKYQIGKAEKLGETNQLKILLERKKNIEIKLGIPASVKPKAVEVVEEPKVVEVVEEPKTKAPIKAKAPAKPKQKTRKK